MSLRERIIAALDDRGRRSIDKAAAVAGTGMSLGVPVPVAELIPRDNRTRPGDVVPSPPARLTVLGALGTPLETSTNEYRTIVPDGPDASDPLTAASPRREGTSASEPSLVWRRASFPIRSIAEAVPVSEEELADIPMMSDIVAQRLIPGAWQRVERMVLSGTGVAPEFSGLGQYLRDDTSALTLRRSFGEVQIDQTEMDHIAATVRELERGITGAIRHAEDRGGSRPTHVLMDQTTVDALLDYRTGEGQFRYMRNANGDILGPFGIPIIGARYSGFLTPLRAREEADPTNPRLPNQGQPGVVGLVGDFDRGANLVMRQGIRIEVGSVEDDFRCLRRTIRSSLRVGLAIRSPRMFTVITVV